MATEAALICLKYAFETLNLDKVIGRAQAENAASRRVLEKIGLKQVDKLYLDNKVWLLYKISKKEWK